MIILFRIFLVCLIIFLLARSFANYFRGGEERDEVREDKKSSGTKKISKDTGEYIDYEEVDKE
jgi:hypothetical protein